MSLGRNVLQTNSIVGVRVSADGSPIYKPAGVTIDWTTVTALGADLVGSNGSVIRSGQKYLRHGQVITKKTPVEIETIAISGAPTGGTFTITVGGAVTPAIPYNASTSYVQGVLQNLSTVGTGNVLVTGTAGTSYVLTFAGILGPLTITASGASLTGGTSPAATPTRTATGTTGAGMFGPYDPAASDGRQTLTRGSCYVMDETTLQYSSGTSVLSGQNDQVGGAIEGGLIFLDRVLHSGTATHTLALGPTLAEFLAAFPLFTFAQD